MLSLTTLAMMPGANFGFGEMAGMAGLFGAAFAIVLTILIIIGAALYIYQALAWQSIARKLKYKNPWLAWIPVANFFLLPILAKKKWTWGLIILLPFALLPFMFIPIVGIILYWLAIMFIILMTVVWTWDIYEKRKYPGWLSLAPALLFIPIINIIALIAHFVIIGFIAWSDRK
jgi:NADH:ubiquinone oxidoreductase subunit 6 (subunit J)